MVAEAEVVLQQSLPVLDVQFFGNANDGHEIEGVLPLKSPVSSPKLDQLRGSEPITTDLSTSLLDVRSLNASTDVETFERDIQEFLPSIRSGSYADIGPRRYMEDEHICIDDLSSHLGSALEFPNPSAFYGIFDGHGGAEASAYVRKHAVKLFFEDVKFPQTSEVNGDFLEEVKGSLRNAFLLADRALADDTDVSSSSGTTALTVLLLGRLLMVANAGDCRAVLCRKGEAMDLSHDHRPVYSPERKRVEELGGYIDDGYLNGVLSVTRALGDWDMKFPRDSPSPLIAEPEFRQIALTEDDEFLIIGCDGIWDVMTSQQAVGIVRRGLRRHDDPHRCARDLVMEALRRNTFDNLTVIVVCFLSLDHRDPLSPSRQRRERCCSLSAEALCSLRNLLDG